MRRVAAVTGVAVAIGAAGALSGCKKSEGAAEGDAGAKGGRGAARGGGAGLTFAADILKVEAKKLDYAVTAPGTIEAFERVQVTARVAGAVDRVGFTEGQAVKKGDILVVIDSQRYQVTVASARASLDKMRALQKDVEAQVTRREGASDKHPGLIPGEELETYRTKVLTAKADTELALQSLHTAELNLRDAFVRAPIDGVIQTRTVETGQYVQAGYVMATLLRQDPMLLRFQVEPLEAPRLKPDMVASFTLRETQRTFTAKITLVAGAADATTHMVPVTAQVNDDGHRYWLRPGSFCDVSVDVGAGREAPVIPRSAARATDRGYVVYVVENDVATERAVQLGMSTKDGWVEVRNGLQAGDWIVVRGADALTSGARVRASRVTSVDGGVTMPPDRPAEGADGGAWRGGGADPAGSGDPAQRGRGRRDGGARREGEGGAP